MPGPKHKMTDEERRELVEKLTDDLEDFVAEQSKASRAKKASEPEDTRTMDEIAEELKNHPAFMKEIDWSKPLPPEIEGLMQLKYESENPTARADSYRDDGNEQFKLKKYKVAIENYTEGIKSKSPDAELNAVLYTNRAAAQYHLGNYRSSFNDCIFARKFKPDHKKAIVRGAQCCYQMNKFKDALRWCDAALMIDPEDSLILELRVKADKGKVYLHVLETVLSGEIGFNVKIGLGSLDCTRVPLSKRNHHHIKRAQERDERRQAAKERKEEEDDKKLLQNIEKRGITVASMKASKDTKLNPLLLTTLESVNPTGAKVYLDDSGVLHWPVIFFYPEVAETDFIHAFNEIDCFYDHLEHMFGPDTEPASWDKEHKYKAENIEIYFEHKDEEKLYKISPQSTLLEALQHKKYIVYVGTPGFILLVKGSKFKEEFLRKYKT